MKQYFYLVMYGIEGDVAIPGKIFLQEHDAIKWGRTLATKHPEYEVSLHKQEITRTSLIEYVENLPKYT